MPRFSAGDVDPAFLNRQARCATSGLVAALLIVWALMLGEAAMGSWSSMLSPRTEPLVVGWDRVLERFDRQVVRAVVAFVALGLVLHFCRRSVCGGDPVVRVPLCRWFGFGAVDRLWPWRARLSWVWSVCGLCRRRRQLWSPGCGPIAATAANTSFGDATSPAPSPTFEDPRAALAPSLPRSVAGSNRM